MNIIVSGIISFVITFFAFSSFNRYVLLPNSKKSEAKIANIVVSPAPQEGASEVLGTSTSAVDSVTFDIDAIFNRPVSGISLDLGSGPIMAGNIVYTIKPGSGIGITAGQNPVITNMGVLSVGGKSGNVALEAGGGISLDGLKITNTDTGTAQKIFNTIKITGQSDIVAGSNTDTLTFAAGPGVSIITTAGTKTLTINSNDPSVAAGWTHGIGTITSTNLSDIVVVGSLDVSSGGITNAGAITGATGLTSSGQITFSAFSTGILHANYNGVLSSSAVSLINDDVVGTLPIGKGGTGLDNFAVGDLLYASGSSSLKRLGIGAPGQVLAVSAGVPSWSSVTGSEGLCPNCLIANPGSDQIIAPVSPVTGLIIKKAGSGTADIFKVTDSVGTTSYLRVDASGNVQLGNGQTTAGVLSVYPSNSDPIAISPVTQGDASFTGTITSQDITQPRTWTFPDLSGIICTDAGNCAGHTGSLGGSGTSNFLTKWQDTYALGNSLLYDNGVNIGIGTTDPGSKLTVAGTGNITGAATLGSTLGVTGATTLSSTLDVTGATNLLSTLGVSGATTLSSTVGITGNTTIGGNLTVSGTGNHSFMGNVGIGTTSPNGYLNIKNVMQYGPTSMPAPSATSGERLDFYTLSMDAFWPGITFNAYNSGSGFYKRTTANTAYTITSDLASNGVLRFKSTGAASAGSSVTWTDAMAIDPNGNVGIGTTNPTSKLTVAGNMLLTGGNAVINGVQIASGGLGLSGYSYGGGLDFNQSNTTLTSYTGDPLIFATGNGNEKMRIQDSGYVGIGTTNPTYKLQIQSSGVSSDVLAVTDGANRIFKVRENSDGSGTFWAYGPSDVPVAYLSGQNNGGIAIGASYTVGVNPPSGGMIVAGNVGIGTTNPTSMLSVGANSEFQVNSTGNIVKINNVATSFPSSQGAVNSILTNDSSGNLSWANPAGTGVIGYLTRTGTTLTPTNAGDNFGTMGNIGIGTTNPTANLDIISTASTGNGINLVTSGNTLTSGYLLNVSSTLTNTTFTGALANIDWSPSGTTQITNTGDLLRINVGQYGNIGNLLNITSMGSSLFSVSQTAITANVPQSFTAAGDVSIAYDLNFTNSSLSTIRSYSSLSLVAGESFNSSNLTFQAFNAGQIVIDSPGGVALNQSQNWMLNSAVNALNFQTATISSLLSLDTANGRVGIGMTSPGEALEINGNILLSQGSNRTIKVATTTTNVDGNNLSISAGTAQQSGGQGKVGGSLYLFGGNGYAAVSPTGGNVYIYGGGTTGANYGNVILAHNGSSGIGSVGIGTITPAAKLEIRGSSGTELSALTLTNDGGQANELTTILFRDVTYSGVSAIKHKLYSGGTSSELGFYTTNSGSTNQNMVINNLGNVGIGTTGPASGFKLDVQGSIVIGATRKIQMYSDYNGGGELPAGGFFGSAGNNGFFMVPSADSGTTGATAGLGYFGSSSWKSALEVSNSSSNYSNLLLMKSGGNVGIGTTSPNGKLHIRDTSSTYVEAVIENANSDTTLDAAGFSFKNNTQEWKLGINNAENFRLQDTTAGSVNVFTVEHGASANSLYIKSGGNIGIGTTTPGVKLDIVGTHVSGVGIARFKGDGQFGFLTPDTTTGTSGAASGFLVSIAGTKKGQFDYTVDANTAVGGVRMLNTVADATNPKILLNDAGNIIFAGTSGNVGIGTTNPGTKLEVVGDSYISGKLSIGAANIESATLYSSGAVNIINSTTATYFRYNGVNSLQIGNGGNNILASVPLQLSNGSTSIPSLTFTNDTNTGIYYPGSVDTLGLVTGGTERMRIDSAGNIGIGTTAFGTNAAGILAIASKSSPTTSITDGIQLYSEDAAGTSELKVMDEAGNATTLSPHNFSLIEGGPSEELAWSYYSEKGGLGINVDMTKTIRLIENMTGEKLIYMKDLNSGTEIEKTNSTTVDLSLARFQALEANGAVTFKSTAEFQGNTMFRALVEFFDNVIFHKDATFLGKTTFNKNTGGKAIIATGSAQVTVVFDSPYNTPPIITASLMMNDATDKSFLAEGSEVFVTNVTEKGFTLSLPSLAMRDYSYNWIALTIEAPTTTKSESPLQKILEQVAGISTSSATLTPTPSLAPSPIPSIELTPTPVSTGSAGL